MAVSASRRRQPSRTSGGPSTVGGVNGWQDDPGDSLPPAVPAELRPVPDLSIAPLRMRIDVTPAPAAGAYELGTPEFRYWSAAEALERGATFWRQFLPEGTTWQPGEELRVLLDEGEDFNAFYDRNALNFFHGTAGGRTVFSGESPDIVCHEQGHGVLDALRPELFDAGSIEAAAFHESFADICAIMAALQLQSLRVAILSDTRSDLSRSSRLSRLAEQLGWAIRQVSPDAVDADCLRNAVNSFFYHSPEELPTQGPAAALSSEPHSFSRVFTGAFFASRCRIGRRRGEQWRQISQRIDQRFCPARDPVRPRRRGNDSRPDSGASGRGTGSCRCTRSLARITPSGIGRRRLRARGYPSSRPGGIGTAAAGHRGRSGRRWFGFGSQQRACRSRLCRGSDPARSYRCW